MFPKNSYHAKSKHALQENKLRCLKLPSPPPVSGTSKTGGSIKVKGYSDLKKTFFGFRM